MQIETNMIACKHIWLYLYGKVTTMSKSKASKMRFCECGLNSYFYLRRNIMQIDLTQGPITRTMLRFAVPMICGNLLQQLYNVVDTLIVGQYLGANALAAVGSAYTLMTFLTSIFLGLCMGSGAVFAIRYGEKNMDKLKEDMYVAFILTAGLTLLINLFIFWKLDMILHFLSVPQDVYPLMRTYLWTVFWGIVATFLYNYYAAVLRAVGNSTAPLLFLGVGAVTNIILDLVFILICHMGVAGAAWATVIAQWISGVGILIYTKVRCPWLNLECRHMHMCRENISEITQASVLTCLQQSVMNLGILMVQGLVNSFGTVVMAAFAAAVKIPLPICHYRILAMPFPHLLHRITEQAGKTVSEKGFAVQP